jgi:hypothetical protein
MSTDTLRLKDATYRPADYCDIDVAVSCGHTEHLQTARGIIAIRPYEGGGRRDLITGVEREKGSKHLMLDWQPQDGDRSRLRADDETTDFKLVDKHSWRPNEKDDAIRWIYERLNGAVECTLEPDDSIMVWANQAKREAFILAVIDDEAIMEYEMPAGTSALRIMQFIGDQDTGGYRTASYKNVPKRWLNAIREAGTTGWIGEGQRCGYVPFPK